MKKTLVALAALASVSAFAQSTVTISGIVDVGFVNVSDRTNLAGAEKSGITRGNNNRIIFSGVEDLGGGMAATFAAQMRFEPNRGTPESGASTVGQGAGTVTNVTGATVPTSRPLFQGETTVGLRGGFGQLKLGRMLTALQLLNGGTFDPWGVTTVAGANYAGGFNTDYVRGGEGRIGNAFWYATPSFGGFTASLSYGFDKGATGKQHLSAAGNYSNGPVNVVVAYERNRFNDNHTTIGGNYDFGSFKLYTNYYITKGGTAADRAGAINLATAVGGSGPTAGSGLVAVGGNIKGWTLGANVPVGATTIRLGYNRWNGNGVAGLDTKESKLGLGVNYALSKRTAIYSDIASQTSKNNLNGLGNNNSITSFDLGIAHSF